MERDDDHQFHGHRRKIPANSSTSALNSGSPTPVEGGAAAPKQLPTEQYMPIANLMRVMRRVLPPHAKISDDAKETVQECVSEFISFITSEANDRCHLELRKTVTAEDVISAMGKLGFDDYIDPLTLYLHRYRESENERDRLPVRRGKEYGSSAATANYVAAPPQWTLHIGGQQGMFEDGPTMVTRDYFKEGPGAGAGGAASSRLPPEYK